MEEKKYPIYKITGKWDQEGDQPFIGNRSGSDCMFKEKLSTEQIILEIEKYKKSILDKYKEKNTTVKNLVVGMTFYKEDVWCMNWFQHYTFNTHLTDNELLKSFRDYVYKHIGEKNMCLMGAEDNWRWKLCRCEHCKKKGIVMIDH